MSPGVVRSRGRVGEGEPTSSLEFFSSPALFLSLASSSGALRNRKTSACRLWHRVLMARPGNLFSVSMVSVGEEAGVPGPGCGGFRVFLSPLGRPFHDKGVRFCPLDGTCQVHRYQVPGADLGLAFHPPGLGSGLLTWPWK